MNFQDSQQKRILAAEKLLTAQSTTLEKFESIRTLITGTNPKVDRALANCSKAFSTIENLQRGDLVKLTAENLPAETSEEKKRKKAILLLIRSWRELQSEIERIKRKLDAKSREEQTGAETTGQIAAFAKGPFGLITLAAIIIVAAWGLLGQRQPQTTVLTGTTVSSPSLSPSPSPAPAPTPTPSPSPATTPKPKTKVIVFEGKKIPLTELVTASGPECTNSPQEAPHYHAKNPQAARALDGTVVADPGGCGYGKVTQVPIEEVE